MLSLSYTSPEFLECCYAMHLPYITSVRYVLCVGVMGFRPKTQNPRQYQEHSL